MSLPPTYSRRKREAEGKVVDVYIYDQVPQKIRVQVVQILREGLGDYYYHGDYTPSSGVYDAIYRRMCRELGVHALVPGEDHVDRAYFQWLEREQNIEN